MGIPRKEQILSVAVELATKGNYLTVTRVAVAERIGCREGLINYYFDTIDNLRREILKQGILDHNYDIICQGIINRDEYMVNVSSTTKNKALGALLL